MKSITEGKEVRTQRVTCEHCKKEFEFGEENLKLLKACNDYKLFGVECQCCGRDYLIRDWDLTFIVKN